MPTGNNIQFLFLFVSPFHNAYEAWAQVAEILLVSSYVVLVLYLAWVASRSKEFQFEWAITLFLWFMVVSKVTNNQFATWGYYPLLLTKRWKHFVVYHILLLLLHLKAGIDQTYQHNVGVYWYTISLIILIAITVLIPVVTAYFLQASRGSIAGVPTAPN